MIIQMNGIKSMCMVYGTVHIAGGERRGLEWFLISPEGLLRESKRGGQLAVSLTNLLKGDWGSSNRRKTILSMLERGQVGKAVRRICSNVVENSSI